MRHNNTLTNLQISSIGKFEDDEVPPEYYLQDMEIIECAVRQNKQGTQPLTVHAPEGDDVVRVTTMTGDVVARANVAQTVSQLSELVDQALGHPAHRVVLILTDRSKLSAFTDETTLADVLGVAQRGAPP
jgi:hypothetical protein